MDYTVGKRLYLQAQYIRGQLNEFGGGNLGDYLLAGGDLIFFDRHLVFRTFVMTDFPGPHRITKASTGERAWEEDPSVVIAPNIIMVPPWGFLQFEVGGFGFVGSRNSYFGQPGTGTSIAFLRVSGQF